MVYILLMLVAGCMIAMQSPINAALSRTVGVLESSLISFTVGACFLALAVFFFGRGQLSRVAETPPWQWIGGILGAVMVLNTVIAVPRIGALTTVLAMIFGNLVMAAVIDNFGWFGLPRLEVKGAAIATVAGQIIAAIIGLFVNLKKNPEIHIRAKLVRWHGATAGEIYRVGVPSIIMGSIGSVMTFGMNKILIAFTTTATAVFGAYFKLQSFIFMPVFGLNNAMVPILSYNYGARKPERVKKTVKLSIFTAIGIMILGFAAFELIPDVLLELFDASETMLSIGTTALRIIGTHFLIAGINVVAMSVYQAVGDPLYSLLSSVTRQLVVLLPAAWLLARTGRLELVWLAFPIAELAALAMSTIFLRKTLRTAECRMADDDYGEVV